MKPVPPLTEDDGAAEREMEEVIIADRDGTTLPQHNNNHSNHRRFQAWVVLVAASALGIIALALERRKDTSAEKWSISILVVSFILSLFGTLCYIYATGPSILSTFKELVLAGFIFLCWCVGLPIIMNPSNSIAVGYTQIVNGNLYVSSWSSFLSAFWIVGDLMGEVYDIYLGSIIKANGHTRQGQWYGLVAASAVVMATSIRVYQSFECDLEVMKLVPTCSESKYAIAASVIGTVSATVFSITKLCLPGTTTTARVMDGLGAILMVVIWSIGFGFITFGQGPGRSIGNLFIATWAAFIISWLIVADCYHDWMGNHGRQQEQLQQANDNLSIDQQETLAETELS